MTEQSTKPANCHTDCETYSLINRRTIQQVHVRVSFTGGMYSSLCALMPSLAWHCGHLGNKNIL